MNTYFISITVDLFHTYKVETSNFQTYKLNSLKQQVKNTFGVTIYKKSLIRTFLLKI